MRRVLTKTSVVRCASISCGQPVIDLRPDLARHHRLQRRVRDFEIEIARALVAGIDDCRLSRRRAVGAGADQEMRDGLDRVLRGREADALQSSPHSAARRSSESARCAPRLFGATAWISSTMTERVVASIWRPDSEPSST